MNEEKYKEKVICENCGFDGEIEIPKGTRINDMECQNCGCQDLTKKPIYRHMQLRPKHENFR